MNFRSLLAIALFLGSFLLPGCQRQHRVYVERASLVTNSEEGVRVTVALDADEKGGFALRATFTAEDAGFHLFGRDIPFDGINGRGVPTRMKLRGNALITSVGSAQCDLQPNPVTIEALHVTWPIYPEGPVTQRLPIRIKRTGTNIFTQLLVSYMACNTDGVCREPMRNKVIHLNIPKEKLAPASSQ